MCAVCFTNDNDTVVNPKYCQHKICFTCYTNLVIRDTNTAKCPECRTPFLNSEDIIQRERYESPIYQLRNYLYYNTAYDYTAIPDVLIDSTLNYFTQAYGPVWGHYAQLVNLAFNQRNYINNIQQQQSQQQEQEQEQEQQTQTETTPTKTTNEDDDDFPYLPPGFSFEEYADAHQ